MLKYGLGHRMPFSIPSCKVELGIKVYGSMFTETWDLITDGGAQWYPSLLRLDSALSRMHAVCVTYESCDSSSSSESLSGFPTESAVAPLRNLNATSDKLVLALAFNANANDIGEEVLNRNLESSQVPIFATDSKAFDVRDVLRNTLTCPIKYVSRLPPTMVTESYCFVVDGDVVSMNAINAGSEEWWKGTGTAIRYSMQMNIKSSISWRNLPWISTTNICSILMEDKHGLARSKLSFSSFYASYLALGQRSQQH
uniref:Nicastrin n=1 Tax=Ascaris lumbricoides TaxID=6252 RepID=A0A0M3HPA2_ASCLU